MDCSFLILKWRYKMKRYLVEVTETLQKQITITANSREEAEQKVRNKYKNEEIVLDESDYIDTEFTVLKEKRIRDIEER
ncbi:DpnD protein [Absiella sp. AM27-20]|nr:DpnD protein [Absiella sp. AM27-20]